MVIADILNDDHLPPHAIERLEERGATQAEVIEAILQGERFPAKHGRTGYRRNFSFGDTWRGRWYAMKQIEAYVVDEAEHNLVITVITRFF